MPFAAVSGDIRGHMMDEADFLVTIANLAIALIAFMMIVVALRQTVGGGINEFQLLVVKSFAMCGFAALFFALLPILLMYFAVPEAWLWRIGNPLLAATAIGIHAWYFRHRKRVAPQRTMNPTNKINTAVLVVGVVLLLLGTAGVELGRPIAPYAFMLLGLLFASATGFLRTLPDFLSPGE